MSKPMTDERLAHWDNMIEVFQELSVEAGRCAYECVTEIRSLREEAMRPEVRKFAKAMEAVLEENDYKGGWEEETIDYLYEKLQEEIKEVYLEARKFDYFGGMPDEIKGDTADLCHELVDVANVCMMLRARLEETK